MTSTSDHYVPNYFNKEYQSSQPSINGLLRSGLFISRQFGVNSQLSIPDSGQETETTNLNKRIKELEFEIDTINTKYDEMKTKLTKEPAIDPSGILTGLMENLFFNHKRCDGTFPMSQYART